MIVTWFTQAWRQFFYFGTMSRCMLASVQTQVARGPPRLHCFTRKGVKCEWRQCPLQLTSSRCQWNCWSYIMTDFTIVDNLIIYKGTTLKMSNTHLTRSWNVKACSSSSSRKMKKMFVCLFGVYLPTREYFSHMQTSPLAVKGFKFWSMLGTHGHCAERVL